MSFKFLMNNNNEFQVLVFFLYLLSNYMNAFFLPIILFGQRSIYSTKGLDSSYDEYDNVDCVDVGSCYSTLEGIISSFPTGRRHKSSG